jgi:hypothetical protein
MRQHPSPSAYVSIRQHTSAYVSIRQHTQPEEALLRPLVAQGLMHSEVLLNPTLNPKLVLCPLVAQGLVAQGLMHSRGSAKP